VIVGSGKTGLNLAPIQRLDMALRPATRAYVWPEATSCSIAISPLAGAAATA
jgi:hypothetical protein